MRKMSSVELIERRGGIERAAEHYSKKLKRKITYDAVAKWRQRGVPEYIRRIEERENQNVRIVDK